MTDVARATTRPRDALSAVLAGGTGNWATGRVLSEAQAGVLARSNGDDEGHSAAPRSTPVRASMAVSLSGIVLTPSPGAAFEAGPKLPQGMAMLLTALFGNQAEPGDVDSVLARLQTDVNFRAPGLEGIAEAGEPMRPIFVEGIVVVGVAQWAQGRGYSVALTADQRQLLVFGQFATEAWTTLHVERVTETLAFSFPDWYSSAMFMQEVGRHAGLLQAYVEASIAHRQRPNAATQRELEAVLFEVVDALSVGVSVLEVLEHSDALQEEEGYQLLWGSPASANAGEAAGSATEPVARVTGLRPKAAMLTFAHSQAELVDAVINRGGDEGTQAGRELLQRFVRYYRRVALAAGDQRLTEGPGGANAPPHPGVLTASPPLQAPLFDAAVGPLHRFTMALQFPDVYDAFASYAYEWERVPVPDEYLTSGGNVDELAGDTPDNMDVAAARFEQSASYLEEDVGRAINDLITGFDVAPGVAATTLALANGLLRFVGTGFRVLFDVITRPENEIQLTFPAPGVYVVRASATPVLSGDEEVVRAPSVAYLPVFAREPEEMAELRVRLRQRGDAAADARRVELQLLLSEPVSHLDQTALEAELAGLEAASGTLADAFAYRVKMLRERLRSVPEESVAAAKLEEEIEVLEAKLGTRATRMEQAGVTRTERLNATFVSDNGPTIELALEAAELGPGHWYVSDQTTAKSHDADATGATKAAAIRAALLDILQGTRGYGRGYCALVIDGRVETVRVAAGTAALLMEAVDNATTIVSIAAVAAAPFTGGASLAILVPVGLIGGIPSAYRLATDYSAEVLAFDLETAMEVVNIVGGVAGAGQLVASARFARLGRALMIVEFGTDGLGIVLVGAQIMEQVEALAGLSPGERASGLLQIMGQAMLDVGLMVGQSVVAARIGADPDSAMSVADVPPSAGAVADGSTDTIVHDRAGDVEDMSRPTGSTDELVAGTDSDLAELGLNSQEADLLLRAGLSEIQIRDLHAQLGPQILRRASSIPVDEVRQLARVEARLAEIATDPAVSAGLRRLGEGPDAISTLTRARWLGALPPEHIATFLRVIGDETFFPHPARLSPEQHALLRNAEVLALLDRPDGAATWFSLRLKAHHEILATLAQQVAARPADADRLITAVTNARTPARQRRALRMPSPPRPPRAPRAQGTTIASDTSDPQWGPVHLDLASKFAREHPSWVIAAANRTPPRTEVEIVESLATLYQVSARAPRGYYDAFSHDQRLALIVDYDRVATEACLRRSTYEIVANSMRGSLSEVLFQPPGSRRRVYLRNSAGELTIVDYELPEAQRVIPGVRNFVEQKSDLLGMPGQEGPSSAGTGAAREYLKHMREDRPAIEAVEGGAVHLMDFVRRPGNEATRQEMLRILFTDGDRGFQAVRFADGPWVTLAQWQASRGAGTSTP